MSEEENLLTILKSMKEETTKLRKSIDEFNAKITDTTNTVIEAYANLTYDLYLKMEEMRALFQWYAEKRTGSRYS